MEGQASACPQWPNDTRSNQERAAIGTTSEFLSQPSAVGQAARSAEQSVQIVLQHARSAVNNAPVGTPLDQAVHDLRKQEAGHHLTG